MSNQLWKRRCSLLLMDDSDEAWDLGDMHVTFEIRQADIGVPDNARSRVENLSRDMENAVQEQFNRVVLQVGYENAPFGVIFTGNIVQFRKGRMDPKTTFLEILAADSHVAYAYATVNQSIIGGSTPQQRLDVVVESLKKAGVEVGEMRLPNTGGILPRGKVLFGLSRARMHQIAADRSANWNVLKGRLNIIPLEGYLQTEVVELTSASGLIGRAEQTENGVTARCLINPQIQVGGLVRINNASVNQTVQAPTMRPLPSGQLQFDTYVGIQRFADVAADGLYRVFVAEHTGDTRGQDWYTDLTLLAVDPVSGKVKES
jgi:hypothetical protein